MNNIDKLYDKPREECGVFGIYSKEIKKDILKTLNYALYSLQHRGQESAGITISNYKHLFTYKSMGLVSDLFSSNIPKDTEGNIAIGHVRYSTTGESKIENAQPLENLFRLGQIAIAHNGNLTNAEELRYELEESGATFNATSDTEVIIKLIARKTVNNFIEGIKECINIIKGAFALVIVVDGKLIGVRDPYGIRPLCLGTNENGDYFISSESCALDAVGSKFIRNIEAGEMVIIDEDGVKSFKYTKEDIKKHYPCAFEHIYFARPESNIDGINVYNVRFQTGVLLAKKNKVDADIVIGVQDSGTIAALGFAKESGIPYSIGLVKNRYIGRTFIMPEQSSREETVKLKFNPIKHLIDGKRVILIDDSLVRGTTSKILIDIVRKAGAKEVHFRSASPVIKSPCYYGVDISSQKELIGAKLSVEEIRKEINADTLEYLTIEDMLEALHNHNYCIGCFTGNYPTDIPKKINSEKSC
ncbi:amidophosphoribosyltransferase [Brachyspira sp.]|uniref:amidophosphoribosyltransferase n=1 Tax=Brachyspira sp. TaxID=1977261 RepID=UPI00261AAB90|nr:amidophosphoribosyltransferase [Brachyspira sp.]